MGAQCTPIAPPRPSPAECRLKIMPKIPFKHFTRNTRGRDFAVGDIHGMYSMLEELLESVGFDPEVDRLFCVGDLIDRGPESDRTLEFLANDWFNAIQGNHERMMIESEDNRDGLENWVEHNGGAWWKEVDEPTQQVFRKAIKNLPIAMEIETEHGLVGVVHADVPIGSEWRHFLESLEGNDYLQYFAVWSRNRLRRAETTGEVPPVEGVDMLIVGHTPLKNATRLENIYYLDTAAAYWEELEGAKLSLLQFQPGIELYELHTNGVLREI